MVGIRMDIIKYYLLTNPVTKTATPRQQRKNIRGIFTLPTAYVFCLLGFNVTEFGNK